MDPTEAFLARANRPTLLSDIDGVLCYLTEIIATALNSRFGLSLVAAQMTTYRIEDLVSREQGQWIVAQFQRGVFYANAVPDVVAIAALSAIRDSGIHVVITSDRPPQTTQIATRQWLARNAVPYDDLILRGRGGKEQILAAFGPARPAVLIDDDPAKWLLARDGVEVWSPRRAWTPSSWRQYPGVWVFDDWAEALQRLGVAECSELSS